MKVLLVRGAFLNKFEIQSYTPIADEIDLRAIGSLYPIHGEVGLPMTRFFAPYDLATITRPIPFVPRMIRALANRTIGDSHFLYGLEKYVREYGPFDLAHGAETYYGYDLQLTRLKEQGWIKRIVLTCWDTIPHNNESLSKKREMKSQVKAGADVYIAVTGRAKEALVSEGVSGGLIQTVYPGVDMLRFRASERTTPHDPIRILVVGRISWEKGVEDVGKVLLGIHSQKIPFICTWVGDGPLRSRLESFADRLPHDSLKVKEVTYGMMPKEYSSHDLLLHLARSDSQTAEQFGMVVAEAMACGLPVVAYDTGALSEVIGDCGIVMNEGDSDAVIRSLHHLMTDSTTYRQISQKGIQRASTQFDSVKQASKVLQLYRSLQ